MVVAIAVVGGEWWLHKHGLRLPQWRTPGQIGVRQVHSCLHLILINSTDVIAFVDSGLIFHKKSRSIERKSNRAMDTLSVSLFQSIFGKELNFVEKGTQFFLWDQFEVGFRFVCNKKVPSSEESHCGPQSSGC